MKARIAISLILLLLVVLFTLQNIEVVTITFILWQFSLPRALSILLVLAIGTIAAWILHSLSRRGQQ